MKRIDEDTLVSGELLFATIPNFPVGRLRKAEPTPSIKNMVNVIAGGEAVTITNFKHGKNGQSLYILGDGVTTLEHGDFIKMKSSTDLLLDVDTVYFFKHFNGIWYEA